MLKIPDANGRLVKGEPEALSVAAHFVAGQGWTMRITIRRQFEEWADAATGLYERLSTPEMVTTLDAAVCAELKL